MNPPDSVAALLFDHSMQAIQAGQFERAEALLRELLQLNSALAEAHANLAPGCWNAAMHSTMPCSTMNLR